MSEEKNTQEQIKKDTEKESPLASIKPKEIPTKRHTFEYHGELKKKNEFE